MNAWSPNSATLPNLVAVGASQTNVPVSKKFPITAGGSKNLVVCITVSAVTGSPDIILRTSIGSGTPVVAKTIQCAAGPNNYYIKINNDVDTTPGLLPLLSLGEVVVSTDAGEAITVTAVQTLQEE
jgi:hypothetical protein